MGGAAGVTRQACHGLRPRRSGGAAGTTGGVGCADWRAGKPLPISGDAARPSARSIHAVELTL